jgi:hypothetical protein
MEGNPYAELINDIRADIKNLIPVVSRFGTVISTDPLKIETGGTVQEKSDLMKNSAIASFTNGDSVLLLPIEDQQRFIILCKVVGV